MYQIKSFQEKMRLQILFYIYIPCFKSVASIKKGPKLQECPLTTYVSKHTNVIKQKIYSISDAETFEYFTIMTHNIQGYGMQTRDI